MIEIKNLKKQFGDNVLFQNFNLKINSGEYVFISGVSGSGKTTLLNMIGGLEKVDEGQIIIDGIDISKNKNLRNYYGSIVGFLFQNFALIENKTVLENMKLVKKQNRSDISIENALRYTGVYNLMQNKIYTLSGGEQQRVALSRLMIKKCNIILADEPTGSLDKKNEEEVMRILDQFNKDGKTVIIVTHNEELKKKGDKVISI